MNHLSKEKSPYLLQHADNPVDWYPWGAEAFRRAGEEDKPVFLSIGYSTCHWCHVMAHESFEDGEVADLLNRSFIAVKVDREERPDIDAVYMSVCQAMTGAGGWPLTVVMTPEQKPFFAGTYLPKHSRYGMNGLVELLSGIAREWRDNRAQLLEAGETITGFLQSQDQGGPSPAEPSRALLEEGVEIFRRSFDRRWGGFGTAPKFPMPHNLVFLLRYAREFGDGEAREMAERTLLQMYRGGIFDHIGGGFSRYSTDDQWLVPHFEKMLYDNALLVWAYLEAYETAGGELYARVARQTLDYVLRELTTGEGAFCCGQDADSEGVEGKYYALTPEEVLEVLGPGEARPFCRRYDITPSGNFEGKSVPNLTGTADYAQSGPTESLQKLYQYRLDRTALHRDDKVLTSWNALMLAAFAMAGRLLNDSTYLEAAKRCDRFLTASLTGEDGRLMLRWREGEAAHPGQLDDYAFYAFALLELYRSTFDSAYLARAAALAKELCALFSEGEAPGLFRTARDSERLISRQRETYDGALPSGNSMAALVLGRLSKLTGDPFFLEQSERQLRYVAGAAQEYPAGHCLGLLALLEAVAPSRELLCAAPEEPPVEFLQFMRQNHGNLHCLVMNRQNQALLSTLAPFTSAYPIPERGALYYLCQNGACRQPTGELAELKRLLES